MSNSLFGLVAIWGLGIFLTPIPLIAMESSSLPDGAALATCVGATKVAEISIDWTDQEIEDRSPLFISSKVSGLETWALPYAYKLANLKYRGQTPLDIPCPSNVSAVSRGGSVVAVDIQVLASDPSSLEMTLRLVNYWVAKFDAMKLSAAPADMIKNLSTFDSTRSFFDQKAALNFNPIGKSIGAWRNGPELISVGIERRDTSPINKPAKYMYLVDIDFSKQVSPFRR